MTDPYRFSSTPADQGRRGDVTRKGRRAAFRGVLWTLLILGAAGNAVTSLGGFNALISLAFGLATVLCIVLLIVDHFRHRG
ncbi:MAG TPA: hypothetical protein K8V84_11470 [Nocardiopsis listeri]|uniref:hypothetical protein n=1 Tax=Nocardiopsis listeri TaxID=53440 RepID=UPI001DEAF428|nr:hypothetical protein [Nocardiopsis listeri]HJE59109.1 hypothetical protein [Nocardiopsis listeri]